ncbi:MAG TPA: HAD family hydrolase, partial [Micromonospora sp.]
MRRVVRPLALFDLDGTLVDRRAAFVRWAAEFVVDQGLDGAALDWLLDTDTVTSGPKGPFLRAACERFRLTEDPDEVWRRYRRRMPELVRCRPADLDALRRLRAAGWLVGVVTNGMADNQLGKIRRTGLAELVDGVCVSDDVGIRKPDPEIFRLAMLRCGGRTGGDGWMVGDDPVLDVAGGRAAGLRTVW